MSTIPVVGYISNAARTEGEVKQALEDLVAGTRQVPGAGQVELAATIAGGSITPAGGGGILVIDTEAAATTDDLANLITTNYPDGSCLLIRNSNAARFVVVKHLAGGAGQITLDRSADYTLDDTKKWLLLVRRGSDWYEVLRGPARQASPVLAKSGTYTVQKEDLGKTILCTGTFTLNFLGAAVLGNGFSCYVKNVGTGAITLDPNSSELIDNQATIVLGPGQGGMVTSDATSWITQGLRVLPPGVGPFPFSGTTAPYGFLLFGSDYSRTTYANLFAVVGTLFGAGDGATTFGLHIEGRSIIAAGTGTVVGSGVDGDVDITANDLTVPSNNKKWITGMPVVFTLSSGTITGLTSDNTYYVVRTSATKVKLATTLANAQDGTTIDFTAKSSPVWTITHTLGARALGEFGGAQDHPMTSSQLLRHRHTTNVATIAGGADPTGGNTPTPVNGSFTGGNEAMNIESPFVATNMIISY